MINGRAIAGFFGGWAGLGRFWAIVLGVVALTGLAVHLAGPPDGIAHDPAVTAHKESPDNHSDAGSPSARSESSQGQGAGGAPAGASRAASSPEGSDKTKAVGADPAKAVRSADRPGRDTPGPTADPDPALLEPAPGAPAGTLTDRLPRIAPDGRRPMQLYAAGFDTETRRARVGLIVAGIGMNEAESLNAARTLPGGVTFAVSPYAANVERVLSAIRLTGHEFLLSLPMEPTEFPLSDPGPQALMTSLPPERNMERLNWALSRAAGFVGVTNALGAMRGERFSGMADQMGVVLRELDRRGLLFVDARADAGPNRLSWGRSVDLIIDEIPTGEQLDLRLEALSRLARDRGSALGLATVPRPVTVDRIAAWANGLLNRGLALAPVTAIASPPAGKETAK